MKLLRLPILPLTIVILAVSTASASHLVLDELSFRLINGAFGQADFVPKAVAVLDSLKSSPSCARLVFQGLMAECQSLERSTDLETALEETKSQYAIKLAICEIAAADVITPAECEHFIPTNRDPRQGQYNAINMHQSRRCLHALHSRQQWWTSYSNNLQNVVVVCEASRSMVEKDETIEIFKAGLRLHQNATSEITSHIAERQEFAKAIRNLEHELQAELKNQTKWTHSFFTELRLNLQESARDVIQVFYRTMTKIDRGTSAVNEKLDNALAKADKLESSFVQLVNETNHIHDLTVHDAAAMDSFADQVITIALHLRHLSESLIRNNESLQLMEASMVGLAAAVINTTASMEDSIIRYNQNLDLIEHRISAMLSWMNGIWMLVVGVLIGSCWSVIAQSPRSRHLKIVRIILVGILLAFVGVEHALQPWISSMMVVSAKSAVNLSRVQFENFVLIATLAILCIYWVYRNFNRPTFTRMGEAMLPRVGVRRRWISLDQPQIAG